MSSHSVYLIDTNQSECEGVNNWFEVCQFNRNNSSNYRVYVNYMLYETRRPLIEFESSDNRGSNGIGIRWGPKIQFK